MSHADKDNIARTLRCVARHYTQRKTKSKSIGFQHPDDHTGALPLTSSPQRLCSSSLLLLFF